MPHHRSPNDPHIFTPNMAALSSVLGGQMSILIIRILTSNGYVSEPPWKCRYNILKGSKTPSFKIHFTSFQALLQPCGLLIKTVPSVRLAVISSAWKNVISWERLNEFLWNLVLESFVKFFSISFNHRLNIQSDLLEQLHALGNVPDETLWTGLSEW